MPGTQQGCDSQLRIYYSFSPPVAFYIPALLYCRYDTIAEGIGNDHVTGNFARAVLDDAFKITDQEAVYMAHYLLRHEGESLQLRHMMTTRATVVETLPMKLLP